MLHYANIERKSKGNLISITAQGNFSFTQLFKLRIRLSKYTFFDKKGLFRFEAKRLDKFIQKFSDENL